MTRLGSSPLWPASWRPVASGDLAPDPRFRAWPVAAGVATYNTLVPTALTPRSHTQVSALFGGLPLVPPGVVPITEWRPTLGARRPSTWTCTRALPILPVQRRYPRIAGGCGLSGWQFSAAVQDHIGGCQHRSTELVLAPSESLHVLAGRMPAMRCPGGRPGHLQRSTQPVPLFLPELSGGLRSPPVASTGTLSVAPRWCLFIYLTIPGIAAMVLGASKSMPS